jgi:DNA modification methylase
MSKKDIVITPYEKNAKEHPPKQIELIARSITRFGWQQPIKVGKDGVIIAGHGRYMAYQQYAEKLELKPMWVIDEKGVTISGEAEKRLLTEREERAYRLADNQINALSGNDKGLVLEELKLIEDPYLMELTGFSADLILESDDADDVVPRVPNVPKSKFGDIYQLGDHRVLCGDSTSEEHIKKLMENKNADMIFTDPPYGVDYVSRVDKNKRKDWGGIKNDDLKGSNLQDFINAALSPHWKARSKYICCNWQSVKDFYEAVGLPNSLIVWDKKSIGMGANYRSQHEFILFWGKLEIKSESNVWSLKRDSISDYTHPTQKPVELITRAITNSSKNGELVYDAFLGSGSTLIAAQKTGRVCYGMELEPKYVDVIVERYVQYTGDSNIIKNGKKIVWKQK